MAAPTFTVNMTAPTVRLHKCPVYFQVDDSTFDSGDGSLPVDCFFRVRIIGRNGTDIAAMPDRFMKARDERLMTPSGFLTIAGTAIDVYVDLRGAELPGYQRNRIMGPSHTWVFTEGEFTIEFECSNLSGETSVQTIDLDVAARDPAKVRTLADADGDFSDWATAWDFMDRNTDHVLVVENGFSGELDIALFDANNLVIEASDPTAPVAQLPVMIHGSVSGNATRLVDFKNGTEGGVIDGLRLQPSAGTSDATMAVRYRGNCNACVNVHVEGDPFGAGDAFGQCFVAESGVSWVPIGNITLNCTGAGAFGTGKYTLNMAGVQEVRGFHVIGGEFKGSVNESIYRVNTNGATAPFRRVAYCKLDNSDVSSKSAMRFGFGEWGFAQGVLCIDGEVRVGSTSDGLATGQGDDFTGVDNKSRSMSWLVGVWATGDAGGQPNIGILSGNSHVRLLDCYAGSDGINLASGTAAGENIGNKAFGCTTIGKIRTGGDTGGLGNYSGIEIHGCYGALGCDARTAVVPNGGISGNQWGGELRVDGATQNIVAWNDLAIVGTDFEGEVTLGDYAVPDSITTIPRHPENPFDLWGVPREAITSIGGVQALAGGTAQLVLVDDQAGDLEDGDTLHVDAVVVGTATSLQLTLRNDGIIAGTIGTPAVTGDLTIDAGDNPAGATIDPAGTDTITVVIDTATLGAKSGTLSVPSDDPDSPIVITIELDVVVAAAMGVSLGGNDLDSGGTASLGINNNIGDAVTAQLTITNTGGVGLDLGVASASGDVSIDAGDDPSSTTIAAGGTATITVELDTASAGAKTGTLTIPSDDAGSPFVINFTATVLAAAAITVTQGDDPAASGGSINAGGDIETGTDEQLTLTLTNTGGSNLALGTITLVGGLTFVTNPSNQILQGGESADLVVRLDTANAIVQAGNITIPSNAGEWSSLVAWDVIPAPAIVTGPTGPDIEIRYLSVAEADAIIGLWLPSTEPLRMVWDATIDTDKPSLLNQATTDFDQVRLWVGRVSVIGQPGAWPRVSRYGETILPGGEPAIPDTLGQSAWSFPALPRDIRIGVALQAAARAAQAAGVDSTLTIVEQGDAGIASKSGGGQSVSVNTTITRAPSSILHPKARQRVKRFLGYTRESI